MSSMTINGQSFGTSNRGLEGLGLQGLRLTSRGRMVLGALVAAPIAVALVVASVSGAANAGSEAGSESFRTVTVQAGESLWSIAERVAPQADPREVIADIEHLNALDGAAVAAGESIAIPAQYAR